MNQIAEPKLSVQTLNYQRRSWHGQLTKVVTPRKFNDIFLFDIDADYDVPPTPKAVVVETYDFPNPSETVSNQVLYKGVSPVLLHARKLLDELLSTEIVQAKALDDFTEFGKKTLKQIQTPDLIEKLRVYLRVLIESREQLSIDRGNNDERNSKQISDRIQENASGFVNILSCNYDLLLMPDDNDNWLNDYSYIHLTLDSRSKLSDVRNAEKFDDNEARMLICLTSQIASYAKQVTDAIDAFLKAIETNQVPKQFVEKAKHVMVQCSRVVYATDQIIRNLHNDSLRGVQSLLKRTNDRLSKTVFQFCEKTKIAIAKFPNIAAVQDMVDAVVDVSHTVSNSKLVLYKQVQSLRQTFKA